MLALVRGLRLKYRALEMLALRPLCLLAG